MSVPSMPLLPEGHAAGDDADADVPMKMKKTRTFFRPTTWWTPGYFYAITSVRLAGDVLVTGCVDKTVKVWEVTGKPRCKYTLFGHTDAVRSVWVEGDTLVSASDDRTLRFWNLSTGKFDGSVREHTERVMCVQASPEVVVSGSQDRSVVVLDAAERKVQLRLHGEAFHRGPVWSLRFQGERLVTGGSDRAVRVTNLETGDAACVLSGHNEIVVTVDLQGPLVASGSLDKTVRIWDLRAPPEDRCVRTLDVHEEAVGVVALQGNYVFAGSSDETISCCEIGSGAIVKHLQLDAPVQALHVTDRQVAIGTRKNVALFDYEMRPR